MSRKEDVSFPTWPSDPHLLGTLPRDQGTVVRMAQDNAMGLPQQHNWAPPLWVSIRGLFSGLPTSSGNSPSPSVSLLSPLALW